MNLLIYLYPPYEVHLSIVLVGFIFACMDLSTNKRDRMLALVEQWRDSGQSRKDFCQLHGIKVSTLSYWIKKSEEQIAGIGFKRMSYPTPSKYKNRFPITESGIIINKIMKKIILLRTYSIRRRNLIIRIDGQTRRYCPYSHN